MSKIFDFVVIVCVLFSLFVSIGFIQDANVEDVQGVHDVSEKTPETKKIFIDFLLKHPVPTNGQLREVKKDINAALVLSEAKKITQNGSLTSESVKEVEPLQKVSEFSDVDKIAFKWFFGSILLAMVLLIFKKMFRDI